MSIQSMMKKKNTRDKLVYWAQSGSTNNDGTPVYSAPAEIQCLWVEDVRLIKDFYEKEVSSRAHAYVDNDLSDNAMIYHGLIADLTAEQQADPRKVKNAYLVLRFEKVPSSGVKDTFGRKVYV